MVDRHGSFSSAEELFRAVHPWQGPPGAGPEAASEPSFRIAVEALGGLTYDWDLTTDVLVPWQSTEPVLGDATTPFLGDATTPFLGDATTMTMVAAGALFGAVPAADAATKASARPTIDQGATTGAMWRSLVHPDDLPDVESRFGAAFGERRQSVGCRYRLRQGEGRYRWVRDHAHIIYGPNGRPARLVGCALHVEEPLRSEEAIAERHVAEHAQYRAELLAEVVELELLDGVTARAWRLVELLVPRLADLAAIHDGGRNGLHAVAHAGPRGLAVHRALGGRGWLGTEMAESVRLAAAGRPQLRSGGPTGDLGEGAPGRNERWSALAVPVGIGGPEPAALLLVRAEPGRPGFGPQDLEYAGELASRLGPLFSRAQDHLLQRDISLALQRALLPRKVLSHPAVEVASRYSAVGDALEVGGDWYDTIELPEGRLGFTVGDVVGHGVHAAAAMGRLRTALNALAPHTTSPALAIADLDAFARRPDRIEFATVCFVTLDPTTGLLAYSSAGHPPPLLVSPSGGARWLTDARSVPICGVRRDRRPEGRSTMAVGETLVLYSDGLVERRGESITDGLARIERLASGLAGAPLEELCDELLRASHPHQDDVVILCVRRLGRDGLSEPGSPT
jgi:hypothetical protein